MVTMLTWTAQLRRLMDDRDAIAVQIVRKLVDEPAHPRESFYRTIDYASLLDSFRHLEEQITSKIAEFRP